MILWRGPPTVRIATTALRITIVGVPNCGKTSILPASIATIIMGWRLRVGALFVMILWRGPPTVRIATTALRITIVGVPKCVKTSILPASIATIIMGWRLGVGVIMGWRLRVGGVEAVFVMIFWRGLATVRSHVLLVDSTA